MKGLIYQLKSVRKDKFCMMSFLLPVVVAVALNFVGSIDLSSLGEFQFGVVAHDTTSEMENWLEEYGSVTVYQTREELILAINEPSTNLIGVERNGNGIKTIISGDELGTWQQTANTLPSLYEQRETSAQTSMQVLERPDILAGYQNIFIAITLIVAMFMGCTFNAMNIISEKEDGVALVNEILPMTSRQYMLQKIFIGFVFGCLSAIVTAAICFRLSAAGAAVMLALLCALWAWFAWDNAADNIWGDGYDVAHSIAGRVESLLQNLGYDPAHMPEADTEAYWKLKSDLALYSSNDQPYILRYSPTVSEENASDPIIVRSPFLILNETAGPDGDPVYYSAGTYYNVDLSEFSEADLRAIQAHMQAHMQDIPPEWQENTPYMTAYGIYIQNQTDYFVPNRIVSCIDGQSWRSARPVAEQTSRKIYFHDLFDSEAAMEHYFEAVRYLNATQQSLDGKKFSDTEWEALRTENFRFDISGISYGLGTVICAYVIDWAAGFRSYFYNFPYLVLGLCLLLLSRL